MRLNNVLRGMTILIGFSLMVGKECRSAVFIYYDPASTPCYSADFEYYRYTIRFDPEDFGVKDNFTIVKVFASADISEHVSVPLIITDVSPQEYPDSACHREEISFSSAEWDTFAIVSSLELNAPFWVSFLHTAQFIPFALAETEVWDPGRNVVESVLGWGSISCDMAVGVVVEAPLGIEEEVESVPIGFTLGQNYPNPFNPSTTISFTTKRRGHINLTVYDVRGRKIDVLVDATLGPGDHTVLWRGDGELPSGIYFYQLHIGENVRRRKMFLSK